MKKLFAETIAIAIIAGEKILKYYKTNIDYVLKNDFSPITQADLESNDFILESLKSTFPVCSEERFISLQERQRGEYYWLVDPLDGTKDFIAQNNHFSVNIALMKKDIPIFGVIYIPAMKKLYAGGEIGFWGLKGEEIKYFSLSPAWEKLQRFYYHQYPRSQFIGCDSKFHSTDTGVNFFKQYQLRKMAIGSSIKFCALSLGIADIYPRFNGSKEWDTAAGDAILRSVGGFLYDTKTQEILRYGKEDLKNNFFIAFSPRLKDIYKEFLK
ncbi:3'(2'),5'-bisphosphate nucleotidase CysQ [Helicobacter cholecystus]|uniref:3'(2'),5'-bisphosphate nucleotidase CysQ n=1 Tax=Helicobacter cholecystus TaxID=45498 RepID=A0A3D8ITK8_9HELI|nr:3'(2'),5'-bisphosphate nucleotidase CysQ [Helicobacter cholecystus]RDU68637.1 3'(2'),5'-bisphosphate nucleotidase CysQ [Helicobacter cholecystus]VEJ24429.1 3'(2'),5'-bisphosphate nucleotidase CysQ [Helicobacter cholecystus]